MPRVVRSSVLSPSERRSQARHRLIEITRVNPRALPQGIRMAQIAGLSMGEISELTGLTHDEITHTAKG
jgi:hypothetical protein